MRNLYGSPDGVSWSGPANEARVRQSPEDKSLASILKAIVLMDVDHPQVLTQLRGSNAGRLCTVTVMQHTRTRTM